MLVLLLPSDTLAPPTLVLGLGLVPPPRTITPLLLLLLLLLSVAVPFSPTAPTHRFGLVSFGFGLVAPHLSPFLPRGTLLALLLALLLLLLVTTTSTTTTATSTSFLSPTSPPPPGVPPAPLTLSIGIGLVRPPPGALRFGHVDGSHKPTAQK